jgi:Flp pilus assembly protein TadG
MKLRVNDDCGSTILEFAIIGLLVLTIMFGVIESARLMLAYSSLAEATRLGARYAIVHGASGPADNPADVVAVITKLTSDAGLRGAQPPVVHYPNGNSNVGSPVEITATYTFTPASFIPLNLTVSSKTRAMICY